MLKKLLVTVAVAIVVYRIVQLYETMDFNKHVYNHLPGPCQYVKGIDTGSEDIEELPNGLLLITSGLFFNQMDKTMPAYKNRKGSVKLFDFAKPEKAVSLKIEHGAEFDPETFNPHGLSSWKDGKSVYVFIVNHLPENKEVVERFQFIEKASMLKHIETFPATDDVLYLNDLVAVGPRSFYYSNYQYFMKPMVALLEVLAGVPWGSVGFYDGDNGTRLVHTGMLIANGINRSPDGRFIYVSHIGNREILVFKRESDNSLLLVQSFPVYTTADNLYVSGDGKSIWTGAHPITWQVVGHLHDGVSIAPSQVLRLTVESGLINDMQEILADDGRLLAGSSVAVYRDSQMIVGTVTNKALVCQIKHL